MLIEKIREATAELHKQTDNFLYPFFQAIKTNSDYIKILETFYAFFQPVMEQVEKYMNREVVTDYAARRSTRTLLHDLEQLGVPAPQVLPATALPVIENEAQAMGAYYVLEGSGMGGVFLSSIIAEKLQLKNRETLSFFYGYGNNTKSMWGRFIAFIETYHQNEQQSAAIIDTAVQTFRLFYNHVQQAFCADK